MKSYPLCPECLSKFEVIDVHTEFHHYPLYILYKYNDFFQKLLFQYKGLYDYALKDTFFILFRERILMNFQKYIIVVAPSSLEENQKRGFAPMETIAKTIFTQVFTGIYKKESYKQSELSYLQRKEARTKLAIHYGEMLTGQHVVILDDVITSGSTLESCIALVEAYHPQSITCLVLSTKSSVFY